MNRLELFPDTVQIDHNSLSIAGCNLADLADRFGTPLYVYDLATLDSELKAYQDALARYYPGKSSITYAGKAFLCLAIAEWAQSHGLLVDCTGLGEIMIAVAAGVKPRQVLVHGVNKSREDLIAACEHAGIIVADNIPELQHLLGLSKEMNIPELWLRFQPGIAVDTHAYRQTGQAGSKFGMDLEQGLRAAQICQENKLPLAGIHFHLGSQFRDLAPLVPGIERALDLALKIGFGENWTLCPGGGLGVAYHEDELSQPNQEEYIHLLSEMIKVGCSERGLPIPQLSLEPGRRLVARAGVAIYSVGAIKQMADRKWVLLDGGLADNPRRALYGARYVALPVREPGRIPVSPAWFAGPYCESGDVLIEALPFPELIEGDLVAVPVSGAYQLSMSSNYNGARRPAVLWLDHGQAQVIREREPVDNLFQLDHRLVKPGMTG
jgi:diaminopimelate decarboxylase